MMTITIFWWVVPLLFFLCGIGGFLYFSKSQGNYDFFSPIAGVASLIFGTAIALTIIITRWLST